MAVDTFEIVFKEPTGTPPSIEWCPLSRLLIDEDYQRSLDHPISEKLIRTIAETWDWRLCGPLTVSKRADDNLYVIDGQHRLAAARIRNDIPHLPVLISRFESVKEEARLFVAINTARRQPTQLDKFHAKLIIGDEEAIEINDIVSSVGLKVGRSPYKIHDGEICCVAVLSRCLKQYGRTFLSAALVNMAEAWPGDAMRSANELVPGLCYLLHNADREFDPDLMLETLKRGRQIDWILKGAYLMDAEDIDYPDEAFASLFVEAYNEMEERAAA